MILGRRPDTVDSRIRQGIKKFDIRLQWAVEYNLDQYIGLFCFDWEENKIKICQYIGLSITYQKIVSYPQMVWNVHVCATTIHSDYEI